MIESLSLGLSMGKNDSVKESESLNIQDEVIFENLYAGNFVPIHNAIDPNKKIIVSRSISNSKINTIKPRLTDGGSRVRAYPVKEIKKPVSNFTERKIKVKEDINKSKSKVNTSGDNKKVSSKSKSKKNISKKKTSKK